MAPSLKKKGRTTSWRTKSQYSNKKLRKLTTRSKVSPSLVVDLHRHEKCKLCRSQLTRNLLILMKSSQKKQINKVLLKPCIEKQTSLKLMQ